MLYLLHQGIYNIIVTKYLDNKSLDYIHPWVETQAFISWYIRAYYHCTPWATICHSVLGRYIIFNIASIIYWIFIIARKQNKSIIEFFCDNSKQVISEYAVGNIVYVDNNCIYCNIYYRNHVPYRITEVFTVAQKYNFYLGVKLPEKIPTPK